MVNIPLLIRFVFVLLGCFALSFATLAEKPAPTVVAKVVWVKGSFSASTPELQSRTLAKADLIYLHDTLSTGDKAQAQIVFTDDTLMTFRPGTKFYVKEYAFSPKEGKGSVGRYVMDLITGGFRTVTGLIAKANPDDYQVNTPVATIGVRGTDYAVFIKDGQLFVGQYKGSPCVSSDKKTLCLDKVTPYANVPNANSAPVPLSQQPDVFLDKSSVVNTTFTPAGTTNALDPNGAVKGILSNFCIQ